VRSHCLGSFEILAEDSGLAAHLVCRRSLNDPEILASKMKLEKRGLEKALEMLNETPKITDFAEHLISWK